MRSNPSLVTRTISPSCTPAVSSCVMTFGCTTSVMLASSRMAGMPPCVRLFRPSTGGQ
jgi:hypothetical protein